MAASGNFLIEDGALIIRAGRIDYAGSAADLPKRSFNLDTVDLGGRLVTPALIDCHTHIIHGGNRAHEFEMRLKGASYAEIARAGGGIVSTVAATRALSADELVVEALPRLDALLAEGVSTVEIKSGYGLTIEAELTMLRAARALETARPVRVTTSYLAAHAMPPEYKGCSQAYLDDVVLPGLRRAHAEGIVDAVDGFCENIAFSTDEMTQVFTLAKSLGLAVKLHAEQLSWQGGARLAARFGALSADHLEYFDEDDCLAMARAGTVAVLLPGAFYAIREKKKPDVGALRRHRVPIAIATDCNPGTSPMTSLLLAMNMAATFFGLTVKECLAGTTRHAARALGMQSETGALEAGKSADIAVWNCAAPAELVYRIGFNPLHARVFRGNAQ
jgi:imidazolonepropionase